MHFRIKGLFTLNIEESPVLVLRFILSYFKFIGPKTGTDRNVCIYQLTFSSDYQSQKSPLSSPTWFGSSTRSSIDNWDFRYQLNCVPVNDFHFIDPRSTLLTLRCLQSTIQSWFTGVDNDCYDNYRERLISRGLSPTSPISILGLIK